MAIMADASLRPRSMVSSGPAPSFAVENLLSLPELTEAERGELRDLACESNAEIFWTELHRFGTRLQEKGNLQAALGVYASIREGGSSELLRGRAQASLDAIEGRGAFGGRAEFLLGRLAADATDPATIGPMLLSSVAFELTKGMALSRFVTVAEPTWWMRGSTGRLAASALGYAVEVPTFTLSSRAAHWLASGKNSLPDLGSDLSRNSLTLGLLKVSGALAQATLVRTLGNLPAPGLRFAVQQGTTFLGMWSAHRLEETLGLRPAQDGATSTADILGSMLSLGAGAHLGRKLLGPGFGRFEQELKLASANLEVAEKRGGGLRPTLSFANLSPPDLEVESKRHQPPSLVLMGLEEEKVASLSKAESRAGEGSVSVSSEPAFDFENIPLHKVDLVKYSIDLTMAYAETLGVASPELVAKLKSLPWVPGYQENIIDQVAVPRVLELFSGYLRKLDDRDTLVSESKWAEVEREFLLYCFASAYKKSGFGRDRRGITMFPRILVGRRVRARMGDVSGIEKKLQGWVEERFEYAPWELYSKILPQIVPLDPFQMVSYEGLPPEQQELFLPEKIDATARELLAELRASRARGLAQGDTASLLQAMREPMSIPQRLRQLQGVVGRKMPPVRRKESRPVVWNPFSVEGRDSLVLHRHHGEGTLLEESDGKVLVRFPDAKSPVKLLSGTVVRAFEREAYREVLAARVKDAEGLPYLYAYLTLINYLSNREKEALSHIQRNWHSTGGIYLSSSEALKDSLRALRQRLDVVGLDKSRRDIAKAPLQETLWDLYDSIGVDPLEFSLKMLIGERPSDLVVSVPAKLRSTNEARNRNFTPDLVREFLQAKPWRKIWGPLGRPYPSHTRAVGHYYPSYYRVSDPRPHDLTDLYFAFRENDPEAFKQFVGLLEEPVEEWMSHGEGNNDSLIVPMIGAAPLKELAESLDYPVVFPWKPRPEDYGKGVEGQRAAVKMRIVQNALKLDSEEVGKLHGKRVLVLDDNATDFITYMWARKLLLDAGASQVGLMALTHTQRIPSDLPWTLR